MRVLVLEGDWSCRLTDPPEWLLSADLVSIAALSGRVSALALAVACDLRVAGDDTTFAWEPAALGTSALAGVVGAARALEWSLGTAPVSARQALAAQLVTTVTSDLPAAVEELVTAVLAVPREHLIETKALLTGAARRTPGEQWKAERQARERLTRDQS